MGLESITTRRIGGANGAVRIPVGTEAQRPTAATGMLRFNSDTSLLELYDGSQWYFFSPAEDMGYIRASDYGFATGASAATNTTALEDAFDAANALGGGIIVLPPGTFSLNNLSTITYSNITLKGAGQGNSGGTVLSRAQTTGDLFAFSGQHIVIKDLMVSGAAVKCTSGYQFNMSDTFQARIENVRMDYVYNGVYMQDGSSLEMDRVLMRYLLGDSGILMTGTNGNGLFSFRFSRIDTDNPYPGNSPSGSSVKTWSTSTAYSVHNVVKVNGGIWQCTSGGTSASSGSGPSGTPGTNGQNAFSTTVTDGTVSWKWVSQNDLTWLTMDNYAYSGSCDNSSLLNGNRGFVMADTANTGSSQPKWFNSQNLEVDHSYGNCIEATGGEGLYLSQGWFGSSLRGNGVEIQAAADGEIYIGDGCRIFGNWFHGILIDNTTVSTIILGNFVALNDQSNTGTNGISIGANTDDFVIMGNISGAGVSGTGSQNYGIFVDTGNSNRYVIQGNLVGQNATGGITDGGTGGTKSVTGNPG